MTVKFMKVWAVIALWAVAAGACPAESPTPGGIEAPPGFMSTVTWREAPVTVDAKYAEQHPEQRGLQATVAADREVLGNHEGRLEAAESNIAALQAQNEVPPPPAGGSASTQKLGEEYEPAGGPEGVSEMFVTTTGLVGGVIALGVVGVLIWIAVGVNQRRDENYGLGTLAQVLNMGEGEIRGSATAPDGRSVAFRAAGLNQQAQPAQPAPPPAPAPQPPGTPAQRTMIRAMLGNAGAAQTDDNIDIVVLAAANQVPPTNLADAQAVNGLVTTLRGQNLLP